MHDPKRASETGPLAGVRIVEFASMASGPFATSLLADQGADVIKLEAPGQGDLIRHMGYSRGGLSAIFNTLNRNKRSLAIDLRKPRGQEIARCLVGDADVFIQNYRSGVAESLGVGSAQLRGRDPRLIYVSISGFGSTGPYASHPAYDIVIQALSGLAVLQADPETDTPELVQTVVCDKVAALQAAQAISAALYSRERSGRGAHIELSLLDATLVFLWPDGMEAQTLIGEGVAIPTTGMRDVAQIHATRDGHITLMVVSDDQFRGLCRALARPDLVDDPRFATLGGRLEHARELGLEVAGAVAGFESEPICTRLREQAVPAAPILSPEALLGDRHILASGLIQELEHPIAGRLRTPRPAARFEGASSPPLRPAPALGEHTREILGELALASAEIDSLAEAGVIQTFG
jgi:crotonobetainyl-CoA:carnitine CoA-transferase CaiB-like acyl-CoA transferase